MRTRAVTTALAGLLTLAAGCESGGGPPTRPSPSAPEAAPRNESATAAHGNRVEDPELGVSYILPAGFRSTETPDAPGLLAVAFVLDSPDSSQLVTQFTLAKVQGPQDYPPGTSADMGNRAIVEASVQGASVGPGQEPLGVVERADLTAGALPGSSAMVTQQAEGTEEFSLEGRYCAFLGAGDRRYAVLGTITDLPPRTTWGSVKAVLDKFAQSIQPL